MIFFFSVFEGEKHCALWSETQGGGGGGGGGG